MKADTDKREFINLLKSSPGGLDKRFKTFVSDLKRKKMTGSFVVAQETVNILKIAINMSNGHASKMMQIVREIGRELMTVAPIGMWPFFGHLDHSLFQIF